MGFMLLFLFFAISEYTTFCEELRLATPANWHRDEMINTTSKLEGKGFYSNTARPNGYIYSSYGCKSSEVELDYSDWGSKLHENTSSLTIKNCNKLTLDFTHFKIYPKFRHLEMVNISELSILKNSRGCLPQYMVLKNIQHINDMSFPYRIQICHGSRLKSLVLKNISMNILSKNFTEAFGNNLRYLEIEDVYIGVAESNSLKLENEDAFVKISKSVIGNAKADFLNFNVSEVTFSNNEIKDFKETDRIMYFEADNVIFKGNKMKTVTFKTMKIISQNVEIVENSFRRIDENAFDNVLPKPDVADSFFNFSKNKIYSVSPKSSEIEIEEAGNSVFANLTIKNNTLACTCENMVWFIGLTEDNNENWDFYLSSNRSTNWKTPNSNQLHQLLRKHDTLCKNVCNEASKKINKASEKHNLDDGNNHYHLSQSEACKNYNLKSKNILISAIIGLSVILAI